MVFCDWYTVNKELFPNGLIQMNCVDIRSENLVKMDNKRINLIQHTLIEERASKDGSEKTKEMGPNDGYNILWKCFQFAKGLEVLQKVYKKLRNEPDSDKKINFLKTRDKLMKEKPLKVMGLPVSYSDTSVSISIENELPLFKQALLSDDLLTEFKSKSKRTEEPIEFERKGVVEEKAEDVIQEEPKDLDAHVVQPSRTTSSKKDYKKSKKKNMAHLKDIFRNLPKRVPKEEKEEEKEASIEEDIYMYPMPEEEEEPFEEPIEEAPQEDMEDRNKEILKPPKSKKHTNKKNKEKKKDPPKPEPPCKLRNVLPTDKRRVSESDVVQKAELRKQRKKRWLYDD